MKSVKIKFITDLSKAMRDIDRLEKRMDRVNAKGLKAHVKSMMPEGAKTLSVADKKGIGAEVAKTFVPGIVKAGNKLGAAFGSLTGTSGLLRTAFTGLNPAIIAAIAALYGFIHAMKQTFHFGNLVEGAKVQLTQFLGSERAAIRDIKAAREFSLKTAFGPAETFGAAASARQFGIDPFATNKYGLKNGKTAMDIIAGLGSFRNPMTGEKIGLNRAAYAVAGGDTRLLRPFGADVRAAYETAKGAGPLRSAAFVSKFIEELGKLPKVLNMAEAYEKTMEGRWSTIAGYAEEFWMALSGASEETGVTTFWSQIEDILLDIRNSGYELTKYILPYVTEYGTYIGAWIKYIWDYLKEIWHLVGPVLIPVLKIIVQLWRVVAEWVKTAFHISISLLKVFVQLVLLPSKLLNILTGASEKVKAIIDKLAEFVVGLKVTFQLFGIFIDSVVKKIINAIDALINKIKGNKDLVALLKGLGTLGLSNSGDMPNIVVHKTEAEAKAAREREAMEWRNSNWFHKIIKGPVSTMHLTPVQREAIEKSTEKDAAERRKKVSDFFDKLFGPQVNNTNYIYMLPFQRIDHILNGSGREVV